MKSSAKKMQEYSNLVGIPGYGLNMPAWAGVLLALIVIWTVIWKGIALWKAARSGSQVWFVVLLLVNTIGILDIIYIYAISKKSKQPTNI